MDQLIRIKTKLFGSASIGQVDKDELLNIYLEDAKDTILELTHLSELPASLLGTQVDLAIIYFNKQGIEGQTAHSEGGVSRSFEEGLPKEILRKIKSVRRLPR